MAAVTGGALVVRMLEKAGVETIFGLHGAHLDTIFQACLDRRIPIVDTRHEVAAGHAAEGYARTKRRLGVAMVTAGPGFTNVVTSLANAYLDRTPVLYIAGSAGLGDAETNTLQAGIDQVALARPVTKWAHRVTNAADLPRLTAEAVRLATAAPTGPVLLDLPVDVLNQTVEEAETFVPDPVLLDSPAAPPDPRVDEALNLLRNAERPVIMAGAGAYMAGAEAELKQFAEHTGIPVYSDFQAHGLLPADHPLYGGTTHKMTDLTAETGRPDVILALGIRFGLFTMGRSDRLVPHDATIIHVESDPKELGLVRSADVAIAADSRSMLDALNARAGRESWPERTAWQETVQTAKRDRRARHQDRFGQETTPIQPYRAVSAIVESLPETAIVIGDGAESYHWLNEVIAQKTPGSYLTHGFLGAVGFGLGLAIGAQTAHPDRPVLCVAGDGAIGFTITEFDTLVRRGLPVVVVVINNKSWAASQHFQEIVAGANRVSGTQLGNARYDEVAAGFGCFARHVTDLADLGPAIKAAFESGRPACINVEVDVAPVPPEVELLMAPH